MKRILCQICTVCLLAVTLCLTGCSGFFGDDTLQIEDVICETLEDGSIKMTITYVDDLKEPDVYLIPKGNEGDDGPTGNGIETITSRYDAVNRCTILTITYSDSLTYPPQEVVIPDGVSIVDINDIYDEVTGAHTLLFVSSNPDIYQFDPITVPKGEKGDTGNGISSYRTEYYEELDADGNPVNGTKFIFVFDDGTEEAIKIPNPNGIMSIDQREEGSSYILVITYTNGDVVEVPFERPSDPNTWLSGPGDNILTPMYGADGDFYYDTAHQEIWLKNGENWEKILSLAANTYSIKFNLNDNDDPNNKASMTGSLQYTINAGACFVADGYDVPVPTRSGYTFMGWYTKRQVNTVTMSAFTDLTPVTCDLTLYALWVKN